MPASVVLAAIYGSEIAAIIALGQFGYAASVFAIRLIAGYAISRLFMPSDPFRQPDGSRVQLPPATNNKLPVLYGTAWLRPIITDAKISTDQTQMWYVCSLCETSDTSVNTINTVVWGDKVLNFDATDQTKVISWTEPDGNIDTRVNGLINVYMYGNGSSAPQNTTQTAIQVLQNGAIDPLNHWTADDRMDKATFIVVRLSYNADIGLTGLDNLNIQITNPITKPGDAMLDYLQNSRYGCGIPLAFIDTTALTDLNTYSDQLINYIDSAGNPQSQPRYRLNGPIDVGTDCFRNLMTIAESADSWVQWNEATAKWGLIINKSYLQLPNAMTLTQLFSVNDNNIVGGIDLNPVDLNNTYNRVEVEYPDAAIRDNSSYAYVDLDPNLLNPNEPDNNLNMQLRLINNSVTAQYIATRRLLQSREDLIITFAMDYSGMQVDAGDVIRVNNSKFNWVDKLFRVTQVVEGKDEQNITIIQITAMEYNDDIYGDFAITEFVPSTNTGITDPNFAVAANTPYITNISAYTNPPRFDVNSIIPISGTYNLMEIYISTTGSTGIYSLLGSLPSSGPEFIPGSIATFTAISVPAGTLHFKVRLRTLTGSYSDFSPASAALIWNPAQLVSVTDILYDSQTPGTLGTNFNLTASAWGNGTWVVFGQPSAGGTRALSSVDSFTWTNRTLPVSWQSTGNATDIIWDGTQFIAVGFLNNTNAKIATSPDGITWTDVALSATFNDTPLYSIAYSGSIYVAASDSGEFITSTDGTTWTKNTSLTLTGWGTNTGRTVRWNGTQFVMAGTNGVVATSTDGITWTYQPQLATTIWGTKTALSVAWNGMIWCLVGQLGACATSPDGITWTWRPNLEDNLGGNFGANAATYIIWNSYRFVVCGEAARSAISTDGITWLEEISLRSPTGGQFLGNANHISEDNFYKLVAVGDTAGLATTPPI